MIFKIILTLTGAKFIPDNILHLIKGQFVVASKNSPQDKKTRNVEDVYGFGSISLFHPKKFVMQPYLLNYEEWFIEFLLDNYELFTNNGVEDFELFIEIYHEDEQCNFEIFDKKQLAKIKHIDLSFPVSVYTLKEDKFKQWANEIDVEWNSR